MALPRVNPSQSQLSLRPPPVAMPRAPGVAAPAVPVLKGFQLGRYVDTYA